MAPPPPTQLNSIELPLAKSPVEAFVNDDNFCAPIFSFHLPAPQTGNIVIKSTHKSAETLNEYNKHKSDSSNGRNYIQDINIEKISNEIFEDVCEDVIQSNNTTPSVFDVILQVINEYLAESQVSQEDDNGSSSGFISLSSANFTFNSSSSYSKLGLCEDNFFYQDENSEKVRGLRI